MSRTQKLSVYASAVGMLILILDARTAITGARAGIDLCLQVVIPSLLPFVFLSKLLTGSLSADRIHPLLRFCRLPGVPKGAEAIVAVGFLGGYPVGASSVRDAWRRGQLSNADAARMLPVCNNAGPAFLFGMAAALFPNIHMAWLLWGIQILSTILVAVLISGNHASWKCAAPGATPSLTDTLKSTVLVMGSISCWVILFRVVIAFLDQWTVFLLSDQVRVILSGMLELSNGCYDLMALDCIGLRFVICSGFLSFGGLCVTLQTKSAADGLDFRYYLPCKLLQTGISLCLASVVQLGFGPQYVWQIPPLLPVAVLILSIFPFFLSKIRNRYGNRACAGV